MTGDNLKVSPPTMLAITAQIEAAGPPHGDEWDLRTVVEQRLHISRTASNQPVIFLEGDALSFGNYGRFPGARHIQQATDMDTGRAFPTLLLPAPIDTIGGAKAMAHVVYEIASALSEQPDVSNEELLLKPRWVLPASVTCSVGSSRSASQQESAHRPFSQDGLTRNAILGRRESQLR